MHTILRNILSANQFLRMQQWKADNGNIQHINDLLKINGFDSGALEKLQALCDPSSIPNYEALEEQQMPYDLYKTYSSLEGSIGSPIIEDQFYDSGNKNTSSTLHFTYPMDLIEKPIKTESKTEESTSWYTDKIKKNSRQLKLSLEPKRTKIYPQKINSFTAIHQDTVGVSWARFSRLDNSQWTDGVRINGWNLENAPLFNNEHVCSRVKQLSNIIDGIPMSDVYIMETSPKLSNFRQSMPSKAVSEIIQINQVNTILTTLLLSRQPKESKQSNVYFLGPSLVGRLYGLYIGRETVSTQPMIRDILKMTQKQLDIDTFTIDINNNVKQVFFNSFGISRECLGKSMLTGLTFLHLALEKK